MKPTVTSQTRLLGTQESLPKTWLTLENYGLLCMQINRPPSQVCLCGRSYILLCICGNVKSSAFNYWKQKQERNEMVKRWPLQWQNWEISKFASIQPWKVIVIQPAASRPNCVCLVDSTCLILFTLPCVQALPGNRVIQKQNKLTHSTRFKEHFKS